MNNKQVTDIANLYKSIYEEKEENLNENTLLDRVRSTVVDAGGAVGAHRGKGKHGNVLGIPERVGRQKGREAAGNAFDQVTSGNFGGAVKTVQDALRETKDSFDIVKGHLIDEGYADTEEAAVAIMANMSEEWKQSILDEGASDFLKGAVSRARQAGASGQGVSNLLKSVVSRARQSGTSMRNSNHTVRTGNLNLPTSNTRNPAPDRDEPLWGPGSKTPDGKPSPTRRRPKPAPDPAPDRDEPLW